MQFFRKLFDTLQAKSGGFIKLVSDDGTLLASSPASPSGDRELKALIAASADALEYRSPRTGDYRVGSYNHLSRYPMTVIVAQNSSAILSEWYGQLRVHGAIVLCILAAIGVLGYRVDQANRATRIQALRDGLTGLANRRCFNQTIEREFRRAVRTGQPLSLIMMDIDLFKNFNDHYGHPSGDACLRAVSAAVQDVLRRPGDLAARFGGEEIAVLLPGTDAAGAVQVAEDMRACVHALAIRHEASPHDIVTLSAGVACWRSGQPATPVWLVGVADAALYAAKARGRDTFMTHTNAERARGGAAAGARRIVLRPPPSHRRHAIDLEAKRPRRLVDEHDNARRRLAVLHLSAGFFSALKPRKAQAVASPNSNMAIGGPNSRTGITSRSRFVLNPPCRPYMVR